MQRSDETMLESRKQLVVLHWWTSVSLRVLGVAFIGLAVPSIIQNVGGVLSSFYYWADRSQPGSTSSKIIGWLLLYSPVAIGSLLQLVLGIICLFRARSLANWMTRGLIGHCWHCGYSLTDIRGHICPECGSPIAGNSTETGELERSADNTPTSSTD